MLHYGGEYTLVTTKHNLMESKKKEENNEGDNFIWNSVCRRSL